MTTPDLTITGELPRPAYDIKKRVEQVLKDTVKDPLIERFLKTHDPTPDIVKRVMAVHSTFACRATTEGNTIRFPITIGTEVLSTLVLTQDRNGRYSIAQGNSSGGSHTAATALNSVLNDYKNQVANRINGLIDMEVKKWQESLQFSELWEFVLSTDYALPAYPQS